MFVFRNEQLLQHLCVGNKQAATVADVMIYCSLIECDGRSPSDENININYECNIGI